MTRALAVLLALVVPAFADPPPQTAANEARRPDDIRLVPDDHDARDVANAPQPGQESGRIDDADPGDSTARVLARGVLWLPKMLFELGMAPIRGGVWAFDRYQLDERYYDTFYNADRTIGVVPTGSYSTGLGILAGLRFVDTNTFGGHESFELAGAYGGDFHESVSTKIDSGRRFGRITLGIGGNFDRRPQDPFYGIGNGDIVMPPRSPVDPRVDPTAVESSYHYEEVRGFASVDVHAVDKLHVIGRGALTRLHYGVNGDDVSIEQAYDPAGLVGFEQGVEHAYGELELRWDGRTRASLWEPRAIRSTGSVASLLVGRVHSLNGLPDFTRADLELQHAIRLAPGPRALTFRFLAEAVSGSRDDVPLSELPSLGGDFLRGYPYQRFRDRASALGTVEYSWDVSHFSDAYLFVDAGRVFESFDKATLDHTRVGFGVGLELHDAAGFLVAGSLASTIDGGIIISAVFTPVLDERPRWR